VDFTESIRGRPVFRIRSERTVGFGPGAGLDPNWYALEKVALTVYPDEGAPVTAHADRAEYDARTKAARLAGNVRWTDEAGALGETERVEFDPATRILRIPTPIHFTHGTFEVRAPSGRYETATRTVLLDGPVQGAGTGETTAGISTLAADRAVYARRGSTVELLGRVSAASRAGDRLSCRRLLIKLSDDAGTVEWIRAFENLRGVLTSSGGEPRGARTAPRSYAGDEGIFLFGPDGRIRSLSLSGAPARVEEPKRRLAARAIDLSFEEGRPVSARARGGVRMVSEESEAESELAEASLAGDGRIETLELEHKVRIRGQGRSGSAERLVELPDRGVWILMGDAQRSATVESEGSRVSAERIEIDRPRRVLRAERNARAVFRPDPSRKTTVVPIGDPARPVFGKAERIVLEEGAGLATLSGGAVLWQEASSVGADDIALNERERSAVAVGRVRAVFVAAPSSGQLGERPQPSVVTARRLLYREAERSALFEGGVVVSRGAWRATGERGEARLGADHGVERLELAGGVTLADRAAGRTGRADRAIDLPPQGKTILHGTPARVTDAQGNQVAGATLTIADRGRSVEVTPPEGGKTETVHRTRAD
jgi:lipopolysaccharide export system protein LptA